LNQTSNDILKRVFSAAEAARILGISRSCFFKRYIKTGRVRVLTGFDSNRIPDSEIERLLSETEPATVREGK
jgi:predicted site-specific integrase-resolvase